MPAQIGDPLRVARKRRGLTQRELASAADVSTSLVSKLEQGVIESTRLETVRRLAVALKIPTTQLISAPQDRSARRAPADQWAGVMEALNRPLQQPEDPPTLEGVGAVLAEAVPLFATDRYTDLAALLPPLIRDADALASYDPHGRELRHRVMQMVAWLLTQAHHYDAAQDVLDRYLADAPDQVYAASMVNTRCWLLLRQTRLADAHALAVRWADDVEPRRMSRASMGELAAWGWMLLRVSAAAVRDNRVAEADDSLRLAHAAAAAMGREHRAPGDYLRTFGPLEVALKRCENASIAGRPDEVLRLAERAPADSLPTTSTSRNRHLLDVAYAQARTRRHAEAVGTLTGVLRDAPEWLPRQQFAQDILDLVVTERRTLTAEMQELADAMER